jgi:hypothetical protein
MPPNENVNVSLHRGMALDSACQNAEASVRHHRAPSILGLKPTGVERLPEQLLQNHLAKRLSMVRRR